MSKAYDTISVEVIDDLSPLYEKPVRAPQLIPTVLVKAHIVGWHTEITSQGIAILLVETTKGTRNLLEPQPTFERRFSAS